MAIIINGKIYRNLQEQVAENAKDIETLQDNQENLATKSELENAITGLYGDFYTREQSDERYPTETHMNYVINHLLQAEDTDYKTELVFEPDDVYLKYYDKDPQNPEEFTWGLVQKCFQVEALRNVHLYSHNIQINAKFKNAGVVDDNYTGRINLTLYLPTNTPLTEETLKQRVGMAIRVNATGYVIETTSQHNYTIIALVKYSDLISTELEVDMIPTNNYAASGLVSAVIGEITSFTDKVLGIL